MHKFVSTLVLSVSAILATSAAMAAPDHRQDDRRYHAQHQDSRWNDNKHSGNWNNNNRYDNNRYNSRVNPSRDWRVGQTLPRAYDSSRYKVSDREARRLPNTGRYQQWYKINGDYVLVNDRTDRIIRIRN
ncbi:RcnB family protein [Acinetobacter gandensis]|uniref:RcnB family protein n=1 Tax=Acinetobacter gandensis TaxID=1443941 RepID=UPI0039892EF6